MTPETKAPNERQRLAAPTDEALERIVDAHHNGSGQGVTFNCIHQHDVCNHTLSGTIEVDGESYGFIVDNGNWDGTRCDKWGDPEDVGIYQPPEPPEPRTFVPTNKSLFFERPEMFKVYAWWRKQAWFADKERAYNYDRHFQPGGYVENHYKAWAAQKGMEPGYLSSFGPDELAVINGTGQ